MKNIWFLLSLLIIGMVIMITLQKSRETPTITIRNHTFHLLTVRTSEEKTKGLSDKEFLPDDLGMIFVFDKPDYYSFWMKDMKFSLDILFIRDDKIVHMYENIHPQTLPDKTLSTYKPDEPADLVLEINAGLAQKYNFQKGDRVRIKGL